VNSTWWRKLSDLDDAQKKFIELSPHGRFLLIGPPGSGKTNLLLLRAKFIAGAGEKNVLIVTFTKMLADFIRSGIASTKLISPSQVVTYHSWAVHHIGQHLGLKAVPPLDDFDEECRKQLIAGVRKANKKVPTKKLYSAILVDEAQDLSVEELEALLCLSDKICISGDIRQGIYKKDGLDVAKLLDLKTHTLTAHYRIGQRIAHVADRLIPPGDGESGLEATCNYNPKTQGKSTAEMHECGSRDQQFDKMLQLILVQLDAFKDELIGVFCSKNALVELRQRFDKTVIANNVCVHGVDSSASFQASSRIHVMTIHSAKGTEFRAVHIFGAEELRKFPMNRREIGYTAITRAKTALNAFRTGETNKPLESAFATPSHVNIEDLFSEKQ
jgi:superfamily I DNA/RNA helicase